MSSASSGVDYFSVLPPIDDYNLIGITVATLIYGANALLYVSCMFILYRKSTSGKTQWPLLVASTILFILATLHVGSSLQTLREAFVQAPRTSIPAASLLYWTTVTTVAGRIRSYCYPLLDTTQDIILIWRLYMVWTKRWKIVVVPIVLEICHTATALYDTADSLKPGRSNNPQSAINIIALTFLASVNLFTTIGIAGRLWHLGSKSIIRSYVMSGPEMNRYMAPILTVVESGAIFTSSMICLLVFIIMGSPLLVLMISISAQLAAFTPYLIVARVGFGLTHGSASEPKAIVDTNIRFGSGNRSRSTGTAVNSSNTTRPRSLSFTENDQYLMENLRSDIETGKEPSLRHDRQDEIFVVDITSDTPLHKVNQKVPEPSV